MLLPPPRSTLFPYTTLFRSVQTVAMDCGLPESRPGPDGPTERGEMTAQTFTGRKRVRKFFRSEEHTSELQSLRHLVCRLLLEKKKKTHLITPPLIIRYIRDR